MAVIGTKEAAERLGISLRRVQQLIEEGTLPAKKLGRDFAIEDSALEKVTVHGKAGRPKKSTPPQINELARLQISIDSMEEGYLREVAITQYESQLKQLKQMMPNQSLEEINKLVEDEVKEINQSNKKDETKNG